jgi:[ribosomal protein S18]-alanine N-acetyltransferase
MVQTKFYDERTRPGKEEKKEIIEFLFKHLEQFGDKKEDIGKAVDFALKESQSFGGFVLVGSDQDKMVGAVVVNKTGMQGYIPENILVYIATHNELRGKGIGKQLMQEAMNHAEGAIALHVEPDNPAKILYEKLGFTNKYLEMRFVK